LTRGNGRFAITGRHAGKEDKAQKAARWTWNRSWGRRQWEEVCPRLTKPHGPGGKGGKGDVEKAVRRPGNQA